jgi:hypothetical protein
MSNLVAIIFCVVMALLTITGKWKATRGGAATLWVLIGFMLYSLGELATSYKAVVIMLNSK